ncbi:MAG TPA: hypothetical protein VD997_14560 [Phycisphaerales bacterium]|nr:hypothetical protein [Phycisphaerales bacterium]
MNEVQSANVVSAVLDEGYPGPVPPEFAEQERVHAALSNKRQLTWAKPSPELGARIMLRASLVRPAAKPRRWPLAMAAGVALAGGLSWLVVLQASRPAITPQPEQPQQRYADATPVRPVQSAPIDLSLLTRLPARSEPTIVASFEQPLMREVQALSEDTQRGIDVVMSRLPVGMSFASK